MRAGGERGQGAGGAGVEWGEHSYAVGKATIVVGGVGSWEKVRCAVPAVRALCVLVSWTPTTSCLKW